jgi:hypothetical protein
VISCHAVRAFVLRAWLAALSAVMLQKRTDRTIRTCRSGSRAVPALRR